MDLKVSERILKNLTILYIEGNKKQAETLKKLLELKANVVVVYDIVEAISVYNDNHIDIIITEIDFKNNTGVKFISNLRKINKIIPIIVITSIDTKEALLSLIKQNLTDYIVKPVDLKNLRDALHRAVVTIYENARFEVRFDDDTIYNVRNKQLIKNGKAIDLTKNEVKLLDLFIYNKNLLLTANQIKEHIWQNSYDISDEAFKSLLNRLRKKIGKETIKNISGIGYKIEIGVKSILTPVATSVAQAESPER